MLINKMTLSKIDVRTIKKYSILLIAGFAVLVLAASSGVLAAGQVKAHGMLTALEDDGTVVIIDDRGYDLSPSATIQDYRGGKTSLDSLLPSSFVEFEYEYTPQGFVVFFIKEIPQ